jgi:hypothetical protein
MFWSMSLLALSMQQMWPKQRLMKARLRTLQQMQALIYRLAV